MGPSLAAQPSPDPLSARIDDVLSELTLDEKIALLSGLDFNRYGGLERLRVPYIKVSDGPNGVRGMQTGLEHILGFPFFKSEASEPVTAAVFPCSTAVAATFDRRIAREAGRNIAIDGLSKNCQNILAPTVNIIRDPRCGRAFECFSEDPTLSADMGAAWIQGCQDDAGVLVTLKHFFGNECETNRHDSNVEVEEPTVREVYVRVFERIFQTLKLSGSKPVAAVMIAYNAVRGMASSGNGWLLSDVLRRDLGFEGLVMSDWFGTYDAKPGLLSELNLEMPLGKQRNLDAIKRLLEEGEISEREHIDKHVRKVLESIARAEEWAAEKGRSEAVYLPSQFKQDVERAVPRPEMDAVILRAATEACVLFKNENDLLPLRPDEKKLKMIALVGEPAVAPPVTGGGSAQLLSHHPSSTLDALSACLRDLNCEDVELVYHPGTKLSPVVELPQVDSHLSDRPVTLQWHKIDPRTDEIIEPAYHTATLRQPEFTGFLGGSQAEGGPYQAIRGSFTLTATTTGEHTFSVLAFGSMTLTLSDAETGKEEAKWHVEGETNVPVFMFNPRRLRADRAFSMRQGKPMLVSFEYRTPRKALQPLPFVSSGFRIGFEEAHDRMASVREAAELASRADVAIVFTATGPPYETEGRDRDSIELPALQNQLVEAVARAAPGRTAVVNASGAAVSMPWADAVAGILQVWFGGQEAGTAIAHALLGLGEGGGPCGRSPFTWPKRIEDHPSWGNFPVTEGVAPPGFGVAYREGRLVGHRWFEKKGHEQPLFWFGQGLSYTSFEADIVRSSILTIEEHDRLEVGFSILVRNTGARRAKWTLQVYVKPSAAILSASAADEPLRRLAFFDCTPSAVQPGGTAELQVVLHREAFASWSEARCCWAVRPGIYEIFVAESSRPGSEVAAPVVLEVRQEHAWPAGVSPV